MRDPARRELSQLFDRFAAWTAHATGTPIASAAAFALVLGWAATGPLFGYSEQWQLVINSTTTVITFLMVFLIQNAQDRDTAAIHLKLGELIRAIEGARDEVATVEDRDEEQLRAERASLREAQPSVDR